MSKTDKTLQKLALVREVLYPALIAGIALTTTSGTAVTLENLPTHCAEGAEVRLIDDQGRIALATALDDDPGGARNKPTFTQIREDGQLVKFYALQRGWKAHAINGYEPEPLQLSDDLYEVARDGRGNLHKLKAARLSGAFRDRIEVV